MSDNPARCIMCGKTGHKLFECPEKIRRCVDIDSSGKFKRDPLCFNCADKHLLSECQEKDMVYARIIHNRAGFFESLRTGANFVPLKVGELPPDKPPNWSMARQADGMGTQCNCRNGVDTIKSYGFHY